VIEAARALRRLVVLLGLLACAPPASVRAEPAASEGVASAPAPADRVRSGARRDYLAEARASFTPENRAYQRLRVGLALLSPLVAVALGVVMVATGLSRRLRDAVFARARGRWRRMLVYFAGYSVVTAVVLLPLDWYGGWALERQFGLSNQSLAAWLLDQVKILAFQVIAVGVVPVLAVAWRVVEAHPRRWWLWISLGTLPVVTASVLLQPLVFDPLFNRFTPLRDASLRRDILALAARAGVSTHDVFEVDMSTRSNKINAYVTGFGASHRIVLWDTTLEKLSRDEILFVMGHEMGHYVLRHIWKGLLMTAVAAFAAFWLTAWLARALIARFGPRWGVAGPGDLAALPLLLAMLGFVNWLGQPLTNYVSRAIEHEADVFALEITHDNDAGARSFLKLAQGNRSNPEPSRWIELFLYSHPPLGQRIRFALECRPWEEGRPNRAYRPRRE